MDRVVLFVVSIYNYHREVLPVVEEFARHGWRVAVIVGWLGDTANEAASVYSKLGCSVHRLPEGIAYGDAARSMSSGRHSGASASPPRLLLRIRQLLSELRLMTRTKRLVGLIADEVRPDVVFFGPFHSCGTFDNASAEVARRRRIPRCCYAVSVFHGAKGAIWARFNNLRMGMLPPQLKMDYDIINRVLGRIFRGWTKTRQGQTIFMWDPVRMLAARLTGLLEKDVWQKPPSDMDLTFVFSEFSRQLLEQSGYPMERVRVVGIPLLDAVFRRASEPVLRAQLFQSLRLREGEDFLLFNVEPSAEHHYADQDLHWRNFRSMMRVVTRPGLPVVLSLHPLCQERDYAFTETEFGVRLSRGYKIHDLYPYARASVSFPCSTNALAPIFGKQLVIYDFFGMTNPTSDRAAEYRIPGARIAATPEEAERFLYDVLRETPGPGNELAPQNASERIRLDTERLLEG